MKPGLMQQTPTAMSYSRKARLFTARSIQFFLLLTLPGINACSRIDDQQPDFAKTPPEAIIEQIKIRIPDATQINFSPVVPGKVWIGTTYGMSKIHQLSVSRKTLLQHLSAYGEAPPPDIERAVRSLDFPAGIFAGTKMAEDQAITGYKEYQSVYIVKNERYLLTSKAGSGNDGYIHINVHPRAYSQFVSTDFDDLPAGIRKLPVSWSGFRSVTMTEEGNGVVFQLEFGDGILEVNNDLEILYSDLGGNTTDIDRTGLPGPISEWIGSNPPPSGLNRFSCRLFRFGGQNGYRVIFQNETQKLHLFFDISGKLRYQYFTAAIRV